MLGGCLGFLPSTVLPLRNHFGKILHCNTGTGDWTSPDRYRLGRWHGSWWQIFWCPKLLPKLDYCNCKYLPLKGWYFLLEESIISTHFETNIVGIHLEFHGMKWYEYCTTSNPNKQLNWVNCLWNLATPYTGKSNRAPHRHALMTECQVTWVVAWVVNTELKTLHWRRNQRKKPSVLSSKKHHLLSIHFISYVYIHQNIKTIMCSCFF